MPPEKPEEDPKKALEEEFQRRYRTRNLFKPDAGPPDEISALQKKAMELRRLGRDVTVPRRVIRPVPARGNGNGAYIPKIRIPEPDIDDNNHNDQQEIS